MHATNSSDCGTARGARGLALAFLLTGGLILLAGGPAVAQEVDPAAVTSPARDLGALSGGTADDDSRSYAAGNLVRSADYAPDNAATDKDPIDCAVAPFGGDLDASLEDGEDVVYVLDLFTNEAYVYDLELDFVTAVVAPDESGFYTGIAYNSTDDSLYWLDLTGTVSLHITGPEGDGDIEDEITGFYADYPGSGGTGTPVGLTYVEATESFWVIDLPTRICYEFEISTTDDIVWTGNFVASADAVTPYGAWGLGLAAVDGEPIFDIPSGDFARGQDWVTRIARVDASGSVADSTNTTQTLDSDLFIETFLVGNAWHATGSGDNEVNYIAGSGLDLVYEIDMTLDRFECEITPIRILECVYATSDLDSVDISWENGEDYDDLVLLVDGEPSAFDLSDMLDEGGQSDEFDVDAGIRTLQFEYTVDDVTCRSGICQILVLGAGPEDDSLSVFTPTGASLLGITVSETNDSVYLPDLFTGECYVYTKELELDSVIDLLTPATGSILTGIACDNEEDLLYWVYDEDGTTAEIEIIVTDLDGDIIADTGFTVETLTAAGAIGDIAMTAGDDTTLNGSDLIANDYVNEQYFIISTSDEATVAGSDIAAPRTSVLGNGIATLPGGAGYEVPVGEITDAQVRYLVHIDPDGEELGCDYDMLDTGGFIADSFIQGSAITVDGPGDADDDEYRYIVGNSFGILYGVPLICEEFSADVPEDFACLFTDGTVELSWTNPIFYDSLEILKNGELLVTLDDPEVEEYTEEDIEDFGLTTYQLVGEDSDGRFAVATCTVTTFPDTTTTIVLSKETLGGLNSAETISAHLETLGVEAILVDSIENIDLTPISMVFACLGTFPYTGILSIDEDDALAGWLELDTGNALYLEGSSYFSVGGGDLDAIDGVEFDVTGDQICDVSTLEGQDTGLTDGPDLSAFSSTYDCEGGFVDRIAPTEETSEALLITDGGTEGFVVYRDALLSDDGLDYRVISSSIEFGGMAAEDAQLDLLCDFIEAMTGERPDDCGVIDTAPEFLRGDADNSGSVSGLLDSLFILTYGFAGGDEPECFDAVDVDGSHAFSALLDALYLLTYSFAQGDAPPDPGPDDCGPDPEPDENLFDCLIESDVCSD